jgi:hypothetical protein
MNSIEDIRKIYCDTEIPDELESRIKRTVRRAGGRDFARLTRQGALAAAAAVLIFAGLVNASPKLAMAMSDLPVIGPMVRVLTYRFQAIDNDHVNAHVETPVIEGLQNDALQNALNQKYFEENKALYQEFTQDMEAIIEEGGHLGVDAGYVIKTDTPELLSIGRYVVNTAASSSTVFHYDTIDKVNEVLITLPSLFKDEQYIQRLSEYLLEKMASDMEADENKIYWIKEGDIEPFQTIKADQSFYITGNHTLVISFDKYEVAPGCMGIVEFEIPTEEIRDLLVSDVYIK